MAQFTFDAQPPDPHRSTKSRVRRDDQSAAGVGNAGPLKRGTEVVERRDGEDLSTSREARWPRASAVFDLGGMSVQAPGRPSFSASASPSIVTDWAEEVEAKRARALGFEVEKNFDEIIRAHIEDELGGKIAN